VTKKARILDVVYNASNNELVRTKTLVKNSVVAVDGTPFRTWFETHYRATIGTKVEGAAPAIVVSEEKKGSRAVQAKVAKRQKNTEKGMQIDPKVVEQFATGRILAVISSRPGQSGRTDGYILEGPELEFYLKKLALKKSGKAK
jgi:small subunit ribosomal protein S8e